MLNGIIAGASQCGTTSLYRYLSANPDVAPSQVKELGYFPLSTPVDADHAREAYYGLFPQKESARLRLEASPAYLADGERVAPQLAQVLPGCRVLFLLRNPVERVQSQYRRLSQVPAGAGISFEKFVAVVTGAEVLEKDPGLTGEIRRRAGVGNYIDYLQPFIDHLGDDAIRVVFNENLRDQPVALMQEVCAFLEINDSMYGEFDFSRENVNRPIAHRGLHRLARRTNRRMETFFSKYPGARRIFRRIYYRINSGTPGNQSGGDTSALEELFAVSNGRLRDYLSSRSNSGNLPTWLMSAEDAGSEEMRKHAS